MQQSVFTANATTMLQVSDSRREVTLYYHYAKQMQTCVNGN